MIASRDLAVAVVCRFSARPRKTLDLVSLGEFNKSEVRIGISAALVEQNTSVSKTILKPVLEVEFFISPADPIYQYPLCDCINASSEHLKCFCLFHGNILPGHRCHGVIALSLANVYNNQQNKASWKEMERCFILSTLIVLLGIFTVPAQSYIPEDGRWYAGPASHSNELSSDLYLE